MLKALRMLVEDLREKARWTYHAEGPKEVAKVLTTDGTLSMVLYRLMQGSRESRLPVLEMAFNKMNAALGCIIGRGTDFGPGFVILHANGVVINGKVRGGANVRLNHQVTIGDDERGGNPVLGSNILIGAGAKVFGNIHVGDGARIGANAVVLKDVEPDTTVVGIPAQPVKRRSAAPLGVERGGKNGQAGGG